MSCARGLHFHFEFCIYSQPGSSQFGSWELADRQPSGLRSDVLFLVLFDIPRQPFQFLEEDDVAM